MFVLFFVTVNIKTVIL